jgi:protein gp37
MGIETGIAWASVTVNPVIGCQKVSPGCDHCYAKQWTESRLLHLVGPEVAGWNGKLYHTKGWIANAKKAHRDSIKSGISKLIFPSLCDPFDNGWPVATRDELFHVIRETPAANWLLLTKRAPNIKKYLPRDWGEGYQNVWLGVSVENKKYGYPRVEVLREIPAKVRVVSCEPLLEDISDIDLNGIHWLIVGGESGKGCRPMDEQWARNLRDKCQAEHVTFFYKQDGGVNGGGHLLDGVQHYNWPMTKAA